MIRASELPSGTATQIDLVVNHALITYDNGCIMEVGPCIATNRGLRFQFEDMPATTIAPRRLGLLVRMDAWASRMLDRVSLRTFDRIATLAGQFVISAFVIYLVIVIFNAWFAGRFNFGGN